MSKITGSVIEANRRRNLEVSEERKNEIMGLFSKPQQLGILTQEEYQEFLDYRTGFYEQLLSLGSMKITQSLHQPLIDLLEYSIQFASDGSMLFLSLFKHYCKNPTRKQTEYSHFYAWAQQVLFGIYFVLDDMVDKSGTRHFQPSYHVRVGREKATMMILLVLHVINEAVVNKFKNESFGCDLSRRFAYYTSVATAGQTLNALTHQSCDKYWNWVNREEHNRATTSPIYDLPFEIAATMAGFKVTQEQLTFWNSMMYAVSMLFRNANDFNDVYPSLPTGKMLYTDIATGVASWCSTSAWQLADAEQREILQENYGFDDVEKIAKVLQVYNEVNLKDLFSISSEALVSRILQKFDQCPEQVVPKLILHKILGLAMEKQVL